MNKTMTFEEKLEALRKLYNDLNDVDTSLEIMAQLDGTSFREVEFSGNDGGKDFISLTLPADVLHDIYFTLKTKLEGKRVELIESANKMIK